MPDSPQTPILLGKEPPRSLKSFGISGVLLEDAKIYYENLFSPKHLGRVTDLLSMILRPIGADELRARLTLLGTFFQAYRAQLGTPKRGWFSKGADPDKLTDPLIIECGVDSEKFALGVAFYLAEGAQINLDGLDLRVSGKMPASGPFEAMLAILHQNSDRLVLKYHPESRRAEILTLHALPGRVSEDQLRGYFPPQIIIFDEKVYGAPKPGSYVELGDVPYQELLKPESGEKSLPPSATGNFSAPGQEAPKPETEVSVSALEQAQLKASQEFLRKRQAEAEAEEVRIEGGGEDLADQSVLKIGGGASGKKRGSVKKKRGGFFKKLLGIQPSTEGAGLDESEEETRFEADSNQSEDAIFKVKGRSSKVQDETEIRIGGEAEDNATPGPEALAQVSGMLEEELQSGAFQALIDTVHHDANQEPKDNAGLKAKMYAQGLLTQLMEERARLNQIAKKFGKTSRQRELEFKNRVQGLEEELRRASLEVEKRDKALAKAKESVSAASAAVDKLKAAQLGGGSEDAKLKQKFEMNQKMLQNMKDENASLQAKVTELKDQVTSAQLMARAQSGPSMEEYGQLQAKYEKIYRQAEDFKRHNRQLMEMLNAPQKPGNLPAPTSEDTRKKIEAASKMAAAAKKDADTVRAKFVESQKEEVKLRIEINKLQAELKEARAAGFKAKGGSGESAA